MNYAIILIAGQSTRFSSEFRKQFFPLNDKPLFYYPLLTFSNHPNIDGVIIVSSPEDNLFISKVITDYNIKKVIAIVDGGICRQESSYNGLLALKEIAADDDLVLIHDGARPLVSSDIISESIELAKNKGAITTAIKAKDSLVEIKDNKNTYLKRDFIFQIQTPQTFKYCLILNAHKKNINQSFNDDYQLLLNDGCSFEYVEGNLQNFKVTTLDDIKVVKGLMKYG